jgi:hypothetical protein
MQSDKTVFETKENEAAKTFRDWLTKKCVSHNFAIGVLPA